MKDTNKVFIGGIVCGILISIVAFAFAFIAGTVFINANL